MHLHRLRHRHSVDIGKVHGTALPPRISINMMFVTAIIVVVFLVVILVSGTLAIGAACAAPKHAEVLVGYTQDLAHSHRHVQAHDDAPRKKEQECGVDEVINYKTCGDLTKALAEAAPDGVDVYFENVGGEHLQAAINVMNPYGRIAACGMISSYNQAQPIPGPNNLMLIVGKKIRINGFIVFDHNDMRAQFLADMESWVSEGQIKTKETIVEGLDNAVDAFLALFTGDNFGKMIVKF